MHRLRVTTTISWLWLAAAMAVQGQQAPGKLVRPLDPPLPVSLESGAPGALPPDSTHPPKPLQKTPVWVTYVFFFGHLEHLDQAADEQVALGNKSAAAQWRTHEQVAAGLEAREGNLLKQVAYDCLQALEDKDVEIQAAVQAFHKQYPDGGFLTAPIPEKLNTLWQERIQIVEQQIGRLRSLLGAERFLALDGYIRSTFVPAIKSPAAADATAAENAGGVQ
jgi:hypothetical protein